MTARTPVPAMRTEPTTTELLADLDARAETERRDRERLERLDRIERGIANIRVRRDEYVRGGVVGDVRVVELEWVLGVVGEL